MSPHCIFCILNLNVEICITYALHTKLKLNRHLSNVESF
uniref:Uncharacterized protein n=1 Tax=Anguilla anguilla TaxID=7936 RepID=A0A0E9UP57_ANGAN